MKKALALLIIFLIFLALTIATVYFSNILYRPAIKDGRGFSFTLKPGGSLQSLVNAILENGGHKHISILKFYARLTNKAKLMKAGHYYFDGSLSAMEIFNKVIEGDIQTYQFTIVEGWTLKQTLDKLNDTREIEHTINPEQPKLPFITNPEPEGMLLPETYSYHYLDSDVDILSQAHDAMQSALAEIWQNRESGLPYVSPYELVIAASLIEKETALAAERPLISSVIINRLKANMPLQFDPTIRYAFNIPAKIPLTYAHTKKSHPFNSYRQKGLCPTPICMPGRASLYAAAHPAKTDYVYFVATERGCHIFNQTLEQHNKSKHRIKNRLSNAKSDINITNSLLIECQVEMTGKPQEN